MNALAGLMNPAAIGQSLTQSFEQGQEKRREVDGRNALTAYAMNPDDPAAFQGLAQHHPQAAMQVRERQQKQQQAALEQHRESIVTGAKIFRQLGVKDDASYQQARGIAQQMGIDLADVPPQYDPQYVQGVIAIADTFAPPKQSTQPASVEEYQFAKGQGFEGGYMDFIETKRGPIVANNGDGTFTIVPRGMAGQQGGAPQGEGPQPGAVEDGYRFKGGNPADRNAWEPVASGGPAPQAPGTFR